MTSRAIAVSAPLLPVAQSDGAKAALAAALTAYALGKSIRVYFDPAIAGCPVQQVSLVP